VQVVQIMRMDLSISKWEGSRSAKARCWGNNSNCVVFPPTVRKGMRVIGIFHVHPGRLDSDNPDSSPISYENTEGNTLSTGGDYAINREQKVPGLLLSRPKTGGIRSQIYDPVVFWYWSSKRMSTMKIFSSQFAKLKLLILVISVFVLVMLSCNSKNNQENTFNEPIYSNVCEVVQKASLYEGKVVNIRGEIKGYHQIVLVSNSCQDEKSVILLDPSEEVTLLLHEQSKGVRMTPQRNNNNIEGEIDLKGYVKFGKGKVVNYGEFVQNIETGEIIQKSKEFEAIEIKVLNINSFVPK
jgi:hypothetical protein